jgi:hypothetical protein
MADLCVAHLVRKQNGPEPLRRFLESYREHDAGVEHDLLLILKGFDSVKELKSVIDDLYDNKLLYIRLNDKGFDIGPYIDAVKAFNYKHFCFINSFSTILCDNWLNYMYRYILEEKVGLVGATGSWGSPHSHEMLFMGKESRYRDFIDLNYAGEPDYRLPEGGAWDPPPFAVAHPFLWKLAPRRLIGKVIRRLGRSVSWRPRQGPVIDVHQSHLNDFNPFPSYHVRTNSFLVSGELFRKLPRHKFLTKYDAYRFESGKNSLTNRVLAMGHDVLVIGRDGRAYAREEWPESTTFWQRDQSNLIVADSQTNAYFYGSTKKREFLSHFAWCERADPFPMMAAMEPSREADSR